MTHTFTDALVLRLREPYSLIPDALVNTWGHKINEELTLIDEAVGKVCTAEQLAKIREHLRTAKPGMIL